VVGQQVIEFHAPKRLRNVVRIRPHHYRNRPAGVQGTDVDEEGPSRSRKRSGLDSGFEDAKRYSGSSAHSARGPVVSGSDKHRRVGPYLFPSDKNQSGHQTTLKTVWHKTLKRAKIPYFRIYDLRSTYATRLSAGGVADEWVTQMLRQGEAKVFKKYSQMKLQMRREALEKINRQASEAKGFDTVNVQCTKF
jgi:integrase